ncbi:hypothetical protein C8R43DRAFT_951007 [Mycena crocata]|nr:hypothetical protein C8R43DRAFT_951007 [Mycena crocata]
MSSLHTISALPGSGHKIQKGSICPDPSVPLGGLTHDVSLGVTVDVAALRPQDDAARHARAAVLPPDINRLSVAQMSVLANAGETVDEGPLPGQDSGRLPPLPRATPRWHLPSQPGMPGRYPMFSAHRRSPSEWSWRSRAKVPGFGLQVHAAVLIACAAGLVAFNWPVLGQNLSLPGAHSYGTSPFNATLQNTIKTPQSIPLSALLPLFLFGRWLSHAYCKGTDPRQLAVYWWIPGIFAWEGGTPVL